MPLARAFEDFEMVLNNEEEKLMALRKANGLVVVAGQPGSGVTSLLQALTREVALSDVRICAVTNNAEEEIPYVTQIIATNEESIESVARRVIHSDPDIVVVHEIRTKAMLELLLNASLTGHLVLAGMRAPSGGAEAMLTLWELSQHNPMLPVALLVIYSPKLCGVTNPDYCIEKLLTGADRQYVSNVLQEFDHLMPHWHFELVRSIARDTYQETAPDFYLKKICIVELLVNTPLIQNILETTPSVIALEQAMLSDNQSLLFRHVAIIKALTGRITLDEVYRRFGFPDKLNTTG